MTALTGCAFYPQEDVLDLEVMQFGQPIKLKNYRYPIPEGQTRRGVVFYLHGYGGYSNMDAEVAQVLTKKGLFEVYAID